MAAPYSVDLRRKVIEARKETQLSLAQLANYFRISVSSVKRYLRLDRDGDDLSAKTEGKGRPGKLNEADYKLIKEMIKRDPTITLAELSKVFYKGRKIRVGRSILSRACQRLSLRRKKLSRYAAEQERTDIKKNAKII